MKRLTTAIVILAILMTADLCAAGEKYVASRHNKPFHTLSCRWAKKIAPEKRRLLQHKRRGDKRRSPALQGMQAVVPQRFR